MFLNFCEVTRVLGKLRELGANSCKLLHVPETNVPRRTRQTMNDIKLPAICRREAQYFPVYARNGGICFSPLHSDILLSNGVFS